MFLNYKAKITQVVLQHYDLFPIEIAIVIVSALITRPDFASQLIVLAPLVLLYEASTHIGLYAERHNAVTERSQ